MLKNHSLMSSPRRKFPLSCFTAYDIRGELGRTIDPNICMRIGRAFAVIMQAKRVVVGRDIRRSSPELLNAVVFGLMAEGVEVIDIGLAGTEEMYFATSFYNADGGIEVTASHNPINYNGMKLVGPGSRPLDTVSELHRIRDLAEMDDFDQPAVSGVRRNVRDEAKRAFVGKVLSFVDAGRIRPLKVVVNCGNGAAGPTFDQIAEALEAKGAPLEFIRVHHQPDPRFPNGIPNPLLPENQPVTGNRVIAEGADLGIAFDGDFDRCFFFDESGRFIPGEYMVGLLAAVFLDKEPGAKIVHDPRVVWNTRDVVAARGGTAIQSRTGHAFVKQAMRDNKAVYGGEMSAHHYFRDFCYCDSGMIPWLLVCELLGRRAEPLGQIVAGYAQAYPSSGEINFRVASPATAIAEVVKTFEAEALHKDETDGVSLEMPDWRFNLRASNTEPVLRLNVESRADPNLISQKVSIIQSVIGNL